MPHSRAPLRPVLPLLAALAAACGGGDATVVGHLGGGEAATRVWALGGPAQAPVEGDSFVVAGPLPDPVELRFADRGGERGRMVLRGVRRGATVRLHGIWIEDGRAYASSAEVDGGRVVEVNGLRMGGDPPDEVDAAGRVLAASRRGDALVLRPADAALPDLRVVVTPGTRVTAGDGAEADADDVQAGDSARVVGVRQGGFVVATELVLPGQPRDGAGGGGGP